MGNSKSIKIRKIMIIAVTFSWFLFQSYVALVKSFKPLLQNPMHLTFGLALALLYNPLSAKIKNKKIKLIGEIIDVSMLLALVYMAWYLISQADRLEQRIQFVSPLLTIDYLAMLFLVIVLLECVRRTMGNSLLVFVLFFIAYYVFGPYFPGILKHSGTTFAHFTDLMVMGNDGIFGTALGASVNFLYYFIFFGALLADYGGGRVLIDIGMKIGKKGYGGPAKAAVLSSGLMGMISGSAVANVSTTGVMTIPLMKKIGYTKEQAAAIEAVASTGGQIMPPIMGVGAFLMAEIVGIPYAEIALRAVVPAFVYYASALLLVDFLARKRNLGKLNTDIDTEELIKTEPVLLRLYLLLPVIVVFYYIIKGRSLMTSAVRGIFAILIINVLQRLIQKRGLDLKDLFDEVLSASKQVADIAIPTGACGLIIGSVVMSGLATKMSNVIAGSGGTSMIIALVVAMFGCLLLGMALPTVAAYLSAYVLFVPALVKIGISPYVANMYLFYFGIFAQITPPVALASFTAAGISGGDTWKTGWLGFRYALVAFLVPYLFVFNPGVLLIGAPLEIIKSIALLLFGTFFLVVAVSGYLFVPIENNVIRLFALLIALATIIPETISTIVGVAAGIVLIAVLLIRSRSVKRHETGNA